MKPWRVATWLALTMTLACVQRLDLSRPDSGGSSSDAAASCEVDATRACFAAPAERANVNRCRAGIERCARDGFWSNVCEGEVLPEGEVCNLVDDDCNGEVDETVAYVPDSTAPNAVTGTSLSRVLTIVRPLDGPSTFDGTPVDSALLWLNGVGAENCSDSLHVEIFDARGERQGRTSALRMPAMGSYVFGLFANRIAAGGVAREYVQPGCSPAIAVDEWPAVSANIRSPTDRQRAWAGSHVGAFAEVMTEQGFLIATAMPDGGDRIGYVLHRVRDDAGVELPEALTFSRPEGASVVGSLYARRDESHIAWVLLDAAGRLGVRVTDLEGRALAEGPDRWVTLSQRSGEITGSAFVGGSLFLAVGRGGARLSTTLVRVSLRDGSLQGEAPMGAYGGVDLAASRNGEEIYACGVGFGLAFMRYSLAGRAMQPPVSLDGRPNRSQACKVSALSTGALVAWSHDLDGVVRWTRVGCPTP